MNKAKALQILAIRLQNRQESLVSEEVDSERKSYPLDLFIRNILHNKLIGTGERCEKNRTYNYPNVTFLINL